eukprot:GHVN01012162.1.p1 GENE.GHVN01012162.1~~GHVN01012162.1.p1  ORF type:complete len:398 (-),score=92.46 GHVN01012162.1:1565-2758(-)
MDLTSPALSAEGTLVEPHQLPRLTVTPIRGVSVSSWSNRSVDTDSSAKEVNSEQFTHVPSAAFKNDDICVAGEEIAPTKLDDNFDTSPQSHVTSHSSQHSTDLETPSLSSQSSSRSVAGSSTGSSITEFTQSVLTRSDHTGASYATGEELTGSECFSNEGKRTRPTTSDGEFIGRGRGHTLNLGLVQERHQRPWGEDTSSSQSPVSTSSADSLHLVPKGASRSARCACGTGRHSVAIHPDAIKLRHSHMLRQASVGALCDRLEEESEEAKATAESRIKSLECKIRSMGNSQESLHTELQNVNEALKETKERLKEKETQIHSMYSQTRQERAVREMEMKCQEKTLAEVREASLAHFIRTPPPSAHGISVTFLPHSSRFIPSIGSHRHHFYQAHLNSSL